MTKRRILSYVLALFVAISSSFYTQREARAIVPVAAVAMTLVNGAGAVLASDALLSLGTAILGGMAMAAIFLIPGDASSVSVRVPLTNNTAATDKAIPPPTAAASAGAPAVKSCGMFIQRTAPYGNTGLLCNGSVAANCPGTYTPGNGSCVVGGTLYQDYGTSTTTTCPSGYKNSGTLCVLENARLASPDRNADLVRGATGGLSAAPDADKMPANVSLDASGNGKIWGTNSKGQPFVSTISPNASGGSDIKTETQISSSSGSAVQTDNYSIGGSGTIVNSSSTVAPGTVTSSETGTSAPAVNTSTTSNPPIVFPSDYARTGEAAAAASSINARLETLHNDLTKQEAPPVDPVMPAPSQFDDSFFKGTFTNLLAWQLPAHQSQCYAPVFDYTLFGSRFHYVMDAHCTIAEQHRDLISSIMVVVWLCIALFIVIGA